MEKLEPQYTDTEVDIDLGIQEILPTEDSKDPLTALFDKITLSSLYENNWHVGDKRSRRGPYMNTYIFDALKDNKVNQKERVDIIDLNRTIFLFKKALSAVRKCVAKGGKLLFIGTESHTYGPIRYHAERCAQYCIAKRWLGGLLTNWHNTFSPYINEMKRRETMPEVKYWTKREQMMMFRKREKFLKFLDGVKDMGNLPSMVIVTSNREKNAIKEAQILGIPVLLLMDTNSNPEDIALPVPGNDRSIKVTEMFCQLIADAALIGLKEEMIKTSAKAAKAEKQNNTIKPE